MSRARAAAVRNLRSVADASFPSDCRFWRCIGRCLLWNMPKEGLVCHVSFDNDHGADCTIGGR